MRVLLFGALYHAAYAPLMLGLARGFSTLGHQVHLVDCNGSVPVVLEIIELARPDLAILFTNQNFQGAFDSFLRWISPGCTVVQWASDDPYDHPTMRRFACQVDWTFSPEPNAIHYYHRSGIGASVLEGWTDPAIFKPPDLSLGIKRSSFLWIGEISRNRGIIHRLLQTLGINRIPFQAFRGHRPGKTALCREVNGHFARTRFMLEFLRGHGFCSQGRTGPVIELDHVSPRVHHAAAAGCPVLIAGPTRAHKARYPEMPTCTRDETVDAVLATWERPQAELDRLALTNRARCLKAHTGRHRAAEILNVLIQEGLVR